MSDAEFEVVRNVAATLGIAADVRNLVFAGGEPSLDSPHKIALAARAAVAVQALAVDAFLQTLGGPRQQISVDRNAAVFALCSGLFQSVAGHDMTIADGARAAVSNFYETRDGRWFHPMGTYPGLRDGMLDLLECANSATAIARAVKTRHGFELEEETAARNLSGAVVRTTEEWRAHPQGKALGALPLVTIEKIAKSPPPSRQSTPHRPLSNCRVLDFTHVIAGPVLARTMAEQGADVLHISAPAHPDPLQFLIDTGWGKRSAYLNLDIDANRKRMRDLAAKAEVFVHSRRPGAMQKFGLTETELVRDHPGLIYVSVDAYGHTGPWADRKGFEQLAQAVTGVAAAEGGSDKPRFAPTGLLADYLAGYLGAAATVSALTRRAQEGGSYRVRVSLARVTMWVQDLGLVPRSHGAPFPPPLPPSFERDTPFGRARHLAPFATFSHAPAHWSLPPTPLGAHEPIWLPR